MQWLIAVLIIAAVAVTGLVVLRFSNASGGDGGWCDQYFANHPAEKKLVCLFAVDDISTRDPNKVQTNVRLVQSPDPETWLAGAEAYYLDAAGYPGGTLIWGGPNRDFNGLSGRTLRNCWYLRDTSGNARVNLVIKTNGSIIAQDNQTVSGSGYSPYCISQNITSDLPNTAFELRLLSGSVRANRMVASTTATPTPLPPSQKPVTVAPITVDVVHPNSTGPNAAIVSQDGVNGMNCNLQVGFKTNTNYRACIVEPGHALNVFSSNYGAFAGHSINVCVGTLGPPTTVHLYKQGQPVPVGGNSSLRIYAQATTVAGTEGLAVFVACGGFKAVSSFDQLKLTSPGKTFVTAVTVSQQ
jgi:hypothetical protein